MKLVLTTILLVSFTVPIVSVNSFASDKPNSDSSASLPGRRLFLKNCAHCHADDATGDEGPDLHSLERPDEFIAKRIRNGVKGKMTAFGQKFSQTDIDNLIAYLRTLK
ncbi:MAG TPA: cytochrome c [Verrucomicrobiae bacterium]|nr:cytochrome c [Verrucomicrobiae bacterium]